jgi:hypothetical protein
MNRFASLPTHFHNLLILLVSGLIGFALALSGCAGISADSIAPPTSVRLSTPIPPYVATDQASSLQARSTIQAGEAMAYNLALTGTTVAIEVNTESTRVALQLTSSAATEIYFARQTQSAGETTATAISAAATSSVATQQAIGTGTAQAATATQVMSNHYVQATATQLAVNELVRQDESQRQSLEFRTWAWRIALVLAFVFGLVLIWIATPWVLLKFFGFQSWNGTPIFVAPDSRGGFKIVDIARSLGPGVVVDEGPPADCWPALTRPCRMPSPPASRRRAAAPTNGLPTEERKRVLRQAALSITPVNGQGMQLPAEISNIQFKVLPPEDSRVGEWLRDVEVRLLEDGEE